MKMAKIMSTSTGAVRTASRKDLSSMVQKKAYELYAKRGKRPGHEMDDWLEAERLVRQRSGF
jgi:hypothetical protein